MNVNGTGSAGGDANVAGVVDGDIGNIEMDNVLRALGGQGGLDAVLQAILLGGVNARISIETLLLAFMGNAVNGQTGVDDIMNSLCFA